VYGINSIKCAVSNSKERIQAMYIQKDYDIDDENIKEIIKTAKSSNIPIKLMSKVKCPLYLNIT